MKILFLAILSLLVSCLSFAGSNQQGLLITSQGQILGTIVSLTADSLTVTGPDFSYASAGTSADEFSVNELVWNGTTKGKVVMITQVGNQKMLVIDFRESQNDPNYLYLYATQAVTKWVGQHL